MKRININEKNTLSYLSHIVYYYANVRLMVVWDGIKTTKPATYDLCAALGMVSTLYQSYV